MSKPELIYFNGKGLGEVIRLIFAEAGVDYIDTRVDSIADLKSQLPFGQAPVLKIDGELLVQSRSISRYLAKRYHLAGSTDLESAKIDALVDGVGDVSAKFITAFHSQDKEQELKKFNEQVLPVWLGFFENILNDGREFFAGPDFTWADISLYYFVSTLPTRYPASQTTIDSFAKVKALTEKVAARPRIAEWLAKRPVTNF